MAGPSTEAGEERPGLLLIDSDLFVVLAGAGLLGGSIAACGFEPGEARRLEALPHMLRRGTFGKRPPETVRRALLACDWIPPLRVGEVEPAVADVQALTGVEKIDDGEAVLFAAAAAGGATVLGTGDKNALRALQRGEGLAGVRERLAGRVVCLEALILRLAEDAGAAAVAEAFRRVDPGHKTLKVIFSEHACEEPGRCLDSAESYLRDLKRNTGGLLRDLG